MGATRFREELMIRELLAGDVSYLKAATRAQEAAVAACEVWGHACEVWGVGETHALCMRCGERVRVRDDR